MEFRFTCNVPKTIEAIGVMLGAEPTRCTNFMRLLKLLYIADRESIQEHRRPITGDHPIAMERGPVLETVYRLIRQQHPEFPVWSEFFLRDRYLLRMIKQPGVGRLSPYEVEKLQDVSQRHAQHDEWDLVEITHQFGEWKKNNPGKSSRHIPLVDILDEFNCRGDLDEIIREAREQAALARLLGA